MDKDSDLDEIDFGNFKGIYEGEQKEKFIDPKTGAHFEYFDLCKRMSRLREQRKMIDQQLGIVHPTETEIQKLTGATTVTDFQKTITNAQAYSIESKSSIQQQHQHQPIMSKRIQRDVRELERNSHARANTQESVQVKTNESQYDGQDRRQASDGAQIPIYALQKPGLKATQINRILQPVAVQKFNPNHRSKSNDIQINNESSSKQIGLVGMPIQNINVYGFQQSTAQQDQRLNRTMKDFQPQSQSVDREKHRINIQQQEIIQFTQSQQRKGSEKQIKVSNQLKPHLQTSSQKSLKTEYGQFMPKMAPQPQQNQRYTPSSLQKPDRNQQSRDFSVKSTEVITGQNKLAIIFVDDPSPYTQQKQVTTTNVPQINQQNRGQRQLSIQAKMSQKNLIQQDVDQRQQVTNSSQLFVGNKFAASIIQGNPNNPNRSRQKVKLQAGGLLDGNANNLVFRTQTQQTYPSGQVQIKAQQPSNRIEQLLAKIKQN